MCGRASTAGQARNRCLTPAGVFEFRKLGSDASEKVNYRPWQMNGELAEWFATPT